MSDDFETARILYGGDESPGDRLREVIRIATARIPGMTMARLCREAKVSRATLYAWFRNDQAPQYWSLGRIAKVLDAPVSDLWAAWEGRETLPSTTEEAISRLVDRLDRNDETIQALVRKLDTLANGAIVAGIARALNETTRPEPVDMPPAPPRRRKLPPQES